MLNRTYSLFHNKLIVIVINLKGNCLVRVKARAHLLCFHVLLADYDMFSCTTRMKSSNCIVILCFIFPLSDHIPGSLKKERGGRQRPTVTESAPTLNPVKMTAQRADTLGALNRQSPRRTEKPSIRSELILNVVRLLIPAIVMSALIRVTLL